jgi:uncharacterized protein with HEPN domain
MNARDRDAVYDVVQAARAALRFRGTDCKDDFLADDKSQSAVIHQLLILGEAAKRLSEEFQGTHADVPWRNISRMRDKLVHHYEGIDLQIIWDTLRKDLPGLIQRLEPLLPPAPEGQSTD